MIGATNLTGLDPVLTYQNLVTMGQTNGTASLFNGSGSAQINLKVTASNAISSSYTITSSYSYTASYDISGSWASASLSASHADRAFLSNVWHVDPDPHSYYQMAYSSLAGVEFLYSYNDGGSAQSLLQMSTSSFYIGQPGAPFQVNSPTTFSVGIRDSTINSFVVFADAFGNYVPIPYTTLIGATSSCAFRLQGTAFIPSPDRITFYNGANFLHQRQNAAGDGIEFFSSNWGTVKTTIDGNGVSSSFFLGTGSYSYVAATASIADTASFIFPGAGAQSDVSNATGSSAGTAGFTNAAELGAFILSVSSSFQTLNGLIAKLRTLGIVS